MIKQFSKDDILVSQHNVTDFFLQIGLNFSDDSHFVSKPLNIPLIIEETLSKHSRKNQKFGKMLHKSHSLDTQMSSQKVLMHSGFFFKHLSHLHSNMKWNLLSLIDYLFHNHSNFLSLDVPNLLTTVLHLLLDLILMDLMDVLDGKLDKILMRIHNVESSLIHSTYKEITHTESAFIKGKAPMSPKHSQFFKQENFSPLNRSPRSPNEHSAHSGSGSPTIQRKPRKKNDPIVKKVLSLLMTMRYLMIPIILFIKFRENALDLPSNNQGIRKYSGSLLLINTGRKSRRKSTFSQEKTSSVLKRMNFLQEEEKQIEGVSLSTISERLVIFSRRQTKKWINLKKLKETQNKITSIKQTLISMEMESVVCSICGTKIQAKYLKDHSNLCKENDELKERLKHTLSSFRNTEIIWLEQSIRKSKNQIPILQQQIERLNNRSKVSETHITMQESIGFLKPPKIKKMLNTCPTPIKKGGMGFGEFKKNAFMMMPMEEEKKVDLEDIQETLKKFRAVKKNRELQMVLREKDILEAERNNLKTLFKLHENIRNYRKLEITFTEESNNFFRDVQSLKGKIDISVWDRAILILKKSEDIFNLLREYFILSRKLENMTGGLIKPRNLHSLHTSPIFTPQSRKINTMLVQSPQGFNRLAYLREGSTKKRSNTSLEKHLKKGESEDNPGKEKKGMAASYFSGQQLLSDKKRKTLEEKDFSSNFSSKKNSMVCLDENSYVDVQELESSKFYRTETLSMSYESQSGGAENLKSPNNDESWFSDQPPKKTQPNDLFVRFFSEQRFDNDKFGFDGKNEDSVTINDFLFIKLISKGAFGRVWLVKRKVTGEYYAMKIINFADKLTNNHLEMLKNENEAFKRLKGDVFVSAIFTFSHENFICFVMEYMYGGDLGALLQKEVYFSENTAKYYIAEIIQAVDALHNIKIIHRDLKPDNVLIDSQGHLKLTDFGLSDLGLLIRKELYGKGLINPLTNPGCFDDQDRSVSTFEEEKMFNLNKCLSMKEIGFPTIKVNNESIKVPKLPKPKGSTTNIVGTPDYMAPEVLNGSGLKDPAVDWWSVGVILFEFLTGVPPFNDETPELIFGNIRQHNIPWDQVNIGYEEGCVSPEAHDLINRLLDPNPKKRLGTRGAMEIQRHKFFRGVDWNNLRKKVPEYIPKVDNILDMGNFEKKKVYDDNEKEDPLFGQGSTNSQKISEATNMIKSSKSFNLKRSDMLYSENERLFTRLDETKKQIKADLDMKEFEMRILENSFKEFPPIPSIEFSEENGYINDF